jgi:hypothetical protein
MAVFFSSAELTYENRSADIFAVAGQEIPSFTLWTGDALEEASMEDGDHSLLDAILLAPGGAIVSDDGWVDILVGGDKVTPSVARAAISCYLGLSPEDVAITDPTLSASAS